MIAVLQYSIVQRSAALGLAQRPNSEQETVMTLAMSGMSATDAISITTDNCQFATYMTRFAFRWCVIDILWKGVST